MPGHVGLRSAFAQVRCDHCPEMVHPAPNGLVGDHDAALRQQIFDVAKAQCEPEIEPDRLLDDLRREPVPFVADFLHSPGYLTAREAASQNRRDNALSNSCQAFSTLTCSNALNLSDTFSITQFHATWHHSREPKLARKRRACLNLGPTACEKIRH